MSRTSGFWVHYAPPTAFLAMAKQKLYRIVFGERSGVVVDPSEERIKSEFDQVTRTYLPMHSVIRIDEVEKQGTSKISKVEGSNVAQFPMPIYTPGDKSS
jgi:hypothetical protein